MFGKVNFTAAQHRRPHFAIRGSQHGHFIEFGRCTPIAFMLAQGDTLLRHFFGQDKGAGAHAKDRRRGAGIGGWGQDAKARSGHAVGDERIGGHSGDDEGAFIGRLD